jgi:MFS family permease
LRHRNFALVWTSALVSNVGTWMETVAVGDLVAVRTGEAGWTGLVAAAAFLPMGLMGPIGGAIADRVDRRKFMLLTTALQMLCAVVLTLLSATDNASPGAVAATVFVAGCVAGIGFPRRTSSAPFRWVPRSSTSAGSSARCSPASPSRWGPTPPPSRSTRSRSPR